MARFSLVGVDGNAYAVMGYTARALKKAGLADKVPQMYEEAKSGDYYNLLSVCGDYIEMANDELDLDDDEEEEW